MRIGLFGGTFNPVHQGHLLLAEGAREQLLLDQLLWIPANAPPHKPLEGNATPEERCRMVELAIAGHPAFRLSRIELDRPAPSYTIETVRQLQAQSPDKNTDWFFLIGSDLVETLPTWRESDALRRLVQFVVIPRPGALPADYPADVKQLPIKTPDLCAADIRRQVREGKSIAGSVPEPVHRYIQERRLYR